MCCYSQKYPELDQTPLEWFSEQKSQVTFLLQLISAELCYNVYSAVGTATSDWSVSEFVLLILALLARLIAELTFNLR